MVGVPWAAEVVFLSFLFALRRLVRSDQRGTLWVGYAGVSLMLIATPCDCGRSARTAPR
jgi:hypothetical protein